LRVKKYRKWMSFSSPMMTWLAVVSKGEVDELLVADDDVVGGGLEGKSDRHAEAGVAARPDVTGRHDAPARAGDDHPPGRGHELAELHGGGVVGVVLGRASRPEDRDLVRLGVTCEHAVSMPHFLHRGRHELELAGVTPVGDQLEPRDQQVADELGVKRAALPARLFDERVKSFDDGGIVAARPLGGCLLRKEEFFGVVVVGGSDGHGGPRVWGRAARSVCWRESGRQSAE